MTIGWTPAFGRAFLAVVAGAWLALAFAPHGWWWVGVAVHGLLLWLLAHSHQTSRTALLTLAFFVSAHLSGHQWLLNALSAEVGWADAVAWLAMLGLALFLALPVAASMALWEVSYQWRMKRRVTRLAWLSAAPFFLLMGEWARSALFGGFSSLYLGYAVLDTPLAGFLPIGGVWLSGWFAFLTAYLLLMLVSQAALAGRARGRARGRVIGLAAVLGLVVWGQGAWWSQTEWVAAAGEPRRVSILQTDVSPSEKFDADRQAAVWGQLSELLERAGSAALFAPETAIPVFMADLPPEVMQGWRQALARRDGGGRLYIGAPLQASGAAYNAVLELGAGGLTGNVYLKSVLMPFGEYTPTGFAWLSPMLDIPLKDMRAHQQSQVPFSVPGWASVGTLICHEDLDGEIARTRSQSAGVLFNPTNLAWLGAWAGPQRLQIARVRAREVGRPIVRAANRDGSALIDHRGELVASAQAGAGVVEGTVQAMRGITPYAWGGSVLVMVMVVALQALVTFCFHGALGTLLKREGKV